MNFLEYWEKYNNGVGELVFFFMWRNKIIFGFVVNLCNFYGF